MSAPEGISTREFARREGCDEALVRRAVKAGRIKPLADGQLPPDAVGSGWRKVNRSRVAGADSGADTADSSAKVRTRVSAPASVPSEDVRTELEGQPHGGALQRRRREEPTSDELAELGLLSLADAERRKETALARLRELEYDTKSGAVVPIVDVARTVGEAFARVRTRLMAIPAEQAPRIHRCKSPAEVQDALLDVIVQALEELCAGTVAPG